MATILVVDDELGIRALLSEILTDEGHTVELAEDAAQARLVRESLRPDLVLLDIWMPDVDGITLLKEWSASGQLTMPVIMMSGHGTIDTAVEATKHGASAFLEKPITLQKLLRAVEQALAKPSSARPCPRCPACARTSGLARGERWGTTAWPPAMPPTRPDCSRRPGPVPSRASTSTGRCARRATPSRKATSNSTWPRKAAR
jgi:DNA-binding NtrC family response regulator